MRKLYTALLVITALALAGCGGGSDNTVVTPGTPTDTGGGGTTPVDITLTSLTLLTSSPQLFSDNSIPVTITAQLQDADNNFVPDIAVSFSADSGGVSVTQPVTDSAGRALAEIQTAGNPTNRTITVTATATNADGTTLSDSVTVNVVGTSIDLEGPSSLASGDIVTFTAVLTDFNGDGIAGENIEVTSAAGNPISANTLTTDTAGQAQFDLTASVGGNDTITVAALGLSDSQVVAVSADTFTFFSPASGTEVTLGVDQTLSLRWQQAGSAVQGQTINFSTTRGTVLPASVVTNASGEASVVVSANNAGTAVITADALNGPSTQVSIEYVADNPTSIEVQADPATVSPNEQATLTAVVRDANNNLVKNQTVIFQLDDITGGTLSVGTAVTNNLGRAQTVYTATEVVSPFEGVVVTASLLNDPSVSSDITFTVAQRELFLAFGTGNSISEPNDAQYEKRFVVQVTDAAGNSVEGVDVQMSVLSTNYIKGYWQANTTLNAWVRVERETCVDEDFNRNGILDDGEDVNLNAHIEAGNIALVTPTTATTDATGSVLISILYPQNYGGWLQVELEGKTEVAGSEFTESTDFILELLASDVNTLDNSPPALAVPADAANNLPEPSDPDATTLVSPFGYNTDCFSVTAPLPSGP